MSKRRILKCPFCGGNVRIVVCDDEGNLHDDEYEQDPWSGLGYLLCHSTDDAIDNNGIGCPIAKYPGEENMGTYIYESPDEAIEAWQVSANLFIRRITDMDLGYVVSNITDRIFKKNWQYQITAIKDDMVEISVKGAIICTNKHDPDFQFFINDHDTKEDI